MKIQAINLYNKQYFTGLNKKPENKNTQNSAKPKVTNKIWLLQRDYIIQKKQRKEEELFNDFLHKKGKITPEEYEDIVKNHPSFIVKAQKLIEKSSEITCLESSYKTMGKVAYILKEYFDSKGDYKIISIGTSPAIFCEVMKCLGSDVEFMPISRLRNYKENTKYDKEQKELYPNLEKPFLYLNSKGINKKECTKPIILLDLSIGGSTLRNTKNFLSEFNGIDPENIEIYPIVSTFADISEPQWKKAGLEKEDIEKIKNDIIRQRVDIFCNVPHFTIYEKTTPEEGYVISRNKNYKKLFKEFDEYSLPRGRAFILCAAHEAKKLEEKFKNKK